jgi:hypothetical protein
MMKLISFIALCSIPVTLSFAPSPPNVYSNRQTLVATRTICPPRLKNTCSSFPRRQAITTAPNLLPWPFQQKHSNRLFVSLLNDENDEQMESWEDDSKDVELVLLLSWAGKSFHSFVKGQKDLAGMYILMHTSFTLFYSIH